MTEATTSARPVLRRPSDVYAGLQAELDGYYTQIRGFKGLDSADVLLEVASISSRLIEIRSRLVRSEDRAAQAIRTKEVDPLLEHLRLLFQVFSRLISTRQMEWEMSR